MLFSYALIQFSNPIIPFRIVIHFSDFIIPLCILLFSAVSNSILVAFELCYAVFQSCYSIVQSSHAVSNPIISFQILSFSFPILLCHYAFFYSVSNSIIRFRIMLCSFSILLFDCTVLSCSFESYYFLSNSVVLFSNSIMFCFQFYYSLSNYVLPNPGLRLFGRRCPGDQ